MRRNKKKNIKLTLLILLLLLGIGFAALAANLKIDGTVNVSKASWDVHFENVQITQGSVTANPAPTSDDATTTEMAYTINFTKPGDYFEFTTDIVNEGTIDAMVDVVSNNAYQNASSTTPITLPTYLTSTVTYDGGVEILPNQELLHNTSEKIKVRVEFKKDIEISDLPSSGDTSIVFKFKGDYKQADNSAVPVPESPLRFEFDSGYFNFVNDSNIKNKITRITITKATDIPESVSNYTFASNNKVKLWLVDDGNNNNTYEMKIGGKGRLYPQNNLAYVFSNMKNLSYVNLDGLEANEVNSMGLMFYYAGYNANEFNVNFGNNFNATNVVDLGGLFLCAADHSNDASIDFGNNFNATKVEDVSMMFNFFSNHIGNSTTINFGNNFNATNLQNGADFFRDFTPGDNINIDLGNNFNAVNLTNSLRMFEDVSGIWWTNRNKNLSFSLGNNFGGSNITEADYMFSSMHYINSLDLSPMNLSKLSQYSNFINGFAGNKIYVKDTADKNWLIEKASENNWTSGSDNFEFDASHILVKGN